MLCVAAGDFELHIDSVKRRGNGVEQSSSETYLREICARATGHLVPLFRRINEAPSKRYVSSTTCPPTDRLTFTAGTSLCRRDGSGKPSGSRQLFPRVVSQRCPGSRVVPEPTPCRSSLHCATLRESEMELHFGTRFRSYEFNGIRAHSAMGTKNPFCPIQAPKVLGVDVTKVSQLTLH